MKSFSIQTIRTLAPGYDMTFHHLTNSSEIWQQGKF